VGALKPTMTARRGVLSKHLQLDEDFGASVDSGATLRVDQETTTKNEDTGIDRYQIVRIARQQRAKCSKQMCSFRKLTQFVKRLQLQ